MDSAELSEKVREEIYSCENCPLSRDSSQGIPGEGPLDANVMFVGDVPSEEEDEEGRPFAGKSGRVFDKLLKGAGLSREEVFVCNVIRCHIPSGKDPSKQQIAACREYLDGEIALVRPQIICTLGRTALQTLLDDPKASITRMNGKAVDFYGKTLVPLFHPDAGLHNPNAQEPTKQGFKALKRIIREVEEA